MASLDDLKKRIASVKSTQKITKAMKMVAAAKLKRAQDSAEKGRPYSEKMNNIILNLSEGISDKENAPKLLSGTGKDQIHLCVVMTSDRGLCGGFNSNIIKKAKSYFSRLSSEGKELKIITVGSKGNDQLKRVFGDKIIENISFKNSKNANFFDAEKVSKIIIEKYQQEEFDREESSDQFDFGSKGCRESRTSSSMAYSNCEGLQGSEETRNIEESRTDSNQFLTRHGVTSEDVADTSGVRGQNVSRNNPENVERWAEKENVKSSNFSTNGRVHTDEGIWFSEPNVGRVAHGVRGRVHRLKGLGNSIVPQIVEEIGKALIRGMK